MGGGDEGEVVLGGGDEDVEVEEEEYGEDGNGERLTPPAPPLASTPFSLSTPPGQFNGPSMPPPPPSNSHLLLDLSRVFLLHSSPDRSRSRQIGEEP
ncbi:hypothetical protein LR48_Vigan02g115100 [Vigna angularis]|uniref:Uncharacterized protein n=1 Tax=Phaseolus angularis TaxID=3914 RepID=A0A0L9TWY7_PHAAN|nr:hypothetical protein LR48_Vigan02g115100 [Vigna angularis]